MKALELVPQTVEKLGAVTTLLTFLLAQKYKSGCYVTKEIQNL